MNHCHVSIRPDVAALPNYVPGKRPQGENPAKLSSNENPYLPPEAVLTAFADTARSVNRYPDMACTELRETLGQMHGVTPQQILVGDGSSTTLLHALTTVAHPGSEVVFAWRSFESYPIAVPTVGCKPVAVPLTDKGDHDLDAMLAAVTDRTCAVIVCTPNNPTGNAITLQALREFLSRLPSSVMVLVDEAYIEFASAPGVATALGLLGEFANLVVMRTFSKAYGLAGLRVGYLVGHEELIAAITRVATPFGVSTTAQATALAALRNRGYVEEAVAALCEQRDATITTLRNLGLKVWDSQTNFFWIPAEDCPLPPAELAARFLDQGVAVRAFPQGVRVSVGLPQDNERLIHVFHDLLVGGSVR